MRSVICTLSVLQCSKRFFLHHDFNASHRLIIEPHGLCQRRQTHLISGCAFSAFSSLRSRSKVWTLLQLFQRTILWLHCNNLSAECVSTFRCHASGTIRATLCYVSEVCIHACLPATPSACTLRWVVGSWGERGRERERGSINLGNLSLLGRRLRFEACPVRRLPGQHAR